MCKYLFINKVVAHYLNFIFFPHFVIQPHWLYRSQDELLNLVISRARK